RLFDTATLREVACINSNLKRADVMFFAPDGRTFVIQGVKMNGDVAVELRETETGRLIRLLDPPSPQHGLTALHVSADVRTVVWWNCSEPGEEGPTLCVVDLRTGKQVRRVPQGERIEKGHLSPD